MERSKKINNGSVEKLSWLIKSLLCAYAVTGILLSFITFVLYKWELDETKVMAGVMSVYILSTFAGGFLAGKLSKKRKFLWGFLTGLCYFAILLFVSYGIYHSLANGGVNVLLVFLLCIAGGTIGGMIS